MRQGCLIAALFSFALYAEEPSFIREVSFEQIEFEGISQDRIQFALTPRIITTQSGTVREIHFSETYLGEIPVYLPPIVEQIETSAYKPVERRLLITVFFRDLESLEPVQRMIEEGRAVARGKAVAEVNLGLLPRLLLWSKTALTPVSFRREIPVVFPGGAFSKFGALALLRTAGAAATLVEAGRSRLGLLWGSPAADPNVLAAIARFELTDKEGARSGFEVAGVAVRYGQKGFLLVRELLEPWAYDADLAAAMQSGRLKLVPNSYDLAVWPAGAVIRNQQGEIEMATAGARSRKQIRLVKEPKEKPESTDMRRPETGLKKLRVLNRASATNITYWEFVDGRHAAIKLDTAAQRWDKLAIHRLRSSGSGGFDIIHLPARRDGDRIVLDAPIDSRAKGSPVISTEGLAGILQNETTALPIASAIQALDLK